MVQAHLKNNLTLLDRYGLLVSHYANGPLFGFNLKLVSADRKPSPFEILFAAFLSSLVAIIVIRARISLDVRDRLLAYGFLVVALPIILYTIFPIRQIVMEYRAYLSSFGASLVAIALFSHYPMALTAILGFSVVQTIHRSRVYSSSVRFWRQASRDMPTPPITGALSYYLSRHGQPSDAYNLAASSLADYLQAHYLNSADDSIRPLLINMALAKFGGTEMWDAPKPGDLRDARRILLEVTRLWPESSDGWRNLGCIYYYESNHPAAADAYNVALTLSSSDGPSWLGLGQVYLDDGAIEDAIDAFRHALDLMPSADHIRFKLLEAYAQSDRHLAEFQSLSRYLYNRSTIFVTSDMLPDDIRNNRDEPI